MKANKNRYLDKIQQSIGGNKKELLFHRRYFCRKRWPQEGDENTEIQEEQEKLYISSHLTIKVQKGNGCGSDCAKSKGYGWLLCRTECNLS